MTNFYQEKRQREGWKHEELVITDERKSPNERLMYECATKYWHAFSIGDNFSDSEGIVMTPELNNPNFEEIVDNIKNGLPYDSKHNDRTT